MDEVEVVGREGPGLGEVVDLEFEVGRNHLGLDGGEVGCDDAGGGVGVGEVDGPDASAGACVFVVSCWVYVCVCMLMRLMFVNAGWIESRKLFASVRVGKLRHGRQS